MLRSKPKSRSGGENDISYITEKIADIAKAGNVNLTEMSKATGIAYHNLYASLASNHRRRDLRDWEMVEICRYLKIDMNEFTAKNRLEACSNRLSPEFVYPKHSADA